MPDDSILWEKVENKRQKQDEIPPRPKRTVPAKRVKETRRGSRRSSDQTVNQPLHHDVIQSINQGGLVEEIRSAVKEPGKEYFSLRLTAEEKRQLADIAYSFKRQGIKTSETEIVRIGLTFLLSDYKETGKQSLLEKVISALRR